MSVGVQPWKGVFALSSGLRMITWLGLKLFTVLDGGGGLGRVRMPGVDFVGAAGSFSAATQDMDLVGSDGGGA